MIILFGGLTSGMVNAYSSMSLVSVLTTQRKMTIAVGARLIQIERVSNTSYKIIYVTGGNPDSDMLQKVVGIKF